MDLVTRHGLQDVNGPGRRSCAAPGPSGAEPRPSPFARGLRALLTPATRVLQLGAGDGRDAAFFASCDVEVTVLEPSLERLGAARRRTAAGGLDVRWICGGLDEPPVRGQFDLVYSWGSIHQVRAADRERLFRRLRGLTRAGGYHAHLAVTDRPGAGDGGRFAPGELARAFAGWAVLRREAGVVPGFREGVFQVEAVEMLVAWNVATLAPPAGRPATTAEAGHRNGEARWRPPLLAATA